MTTTKSPTSLPPAASWLPHFKAIKPETIEANIRQILSENKAAIDELLKQTPQSYTWNNFVEPMDELSERLSLAWGPVSHLHAVMQSDALRDAYNACIPVI